MTTPDITAIRAQYSDGEYLDAYPGEGCATILAICDEVDRLRAENERLRIENESLIIERDHFEAEIKLRNRIPSMNDYAARMQAENERLQTIIGNLHTVEGKHRETANAHFHRANRLQAENERLRSTLFAISVASLDDFWNCGGIARAALAQKGDQK